jgi:hypothetical protein
MSEKFPGWETDKFGTMTLTVECRQVVAAIQKTELRRRPLGERSAA